MVCATLEDIARLPAPDGLVPASQTNYGKNGWPEVARDPEPFLSLGLCSREWLDQALAVLLEAASLDYLDGTSLVHLDVRSDNMFFRDGRAVLVDWNLAALGNPEFDLAFWLPSLRMEGGPEPESVCRPHPSVVALVAGFFAGRAGLPAIPTAPRVREVQRRQLEVALPWAVRSLDLPPLR
jgi:aminoglycoside phosphotransferase (APT) family kinase protein